MHEDIRTFLRRFTTDALTERGVLSKDPRFRYLLRGTNIASLISLMEDHEILRLEATERNWFLTSDYEFSNPSGQHKNGDAKDPTNHSSVFNDQNPHINPFFKSSARPDDSDVESYESEESSPETEEIKFGLERDLQRALRGSLHQLESGLRIDDGGVEKTVDGGRIDITAKDDKGKIVVIELKAGTAQPEAIAQVLAYMATIENPDDKPVRGILIASDFHPRVIQAARAVSNLSLKAYSIQFNFDDR